MKKLIVGISILLTVLSFNSCTPYDDYYGDFVYTTSYFAHDQMDRSVIIDEYDFIQVGAVLGGKIINDRDEWVQYELVNDLVTTAGYEVLPSSLYEFENNDFEGVTNVITIPYGEMLGMMKVKLKPEFFSDPKALSGNYALAYRIIDASTDSIGNKETLVTFKYLSNAVGFYKHSGRAISNTETLVYKNDEIELTTSEPVGSNSVQSEKVSLGSFDLAFNLKIDGDNKVTVTEGTGSDFPINSLNPGFFDRENDHNIYLNYSFENDGKIYEAQDTLVFIKRIIDNVIQWDTKYF